MDPTLDYQNLKFDPFCTENSILLNNINDPDVNLFNDSNLRNLKGSPSAEPSLCFLKYIITKFCFINSILTKDISIESSFKVSFVFTAAINSKRVLNFPLTR